MIPHPNRADALAAKRNAERMEGYVPTVWRALTIAQEYGELMYDAGFAKDVEARLLARCRAQAVYAKLHDAIAAIEEREL